MANTIDKATLILKEYKRAFFNATPFLKSMIRQFDGTHTALGAKGGEDIRVPAINRFKTRTGKTRDPQDWGDKYVTLSKTNIFGSDFNFSWAEVSQDLSGSIVQNVKMAAASVGAEVETFLMQEAYKGIYNAITMPTTSIDRTDILRCGEMLNDFHAPPSGRYGVITTSAQTELLDANASLFNPTASIGRQYVSGVIGPAYGFDLASSPLVPTLTNTADVAGAINGADQGASTAATSLTVDGFSVAPAEGSIITIGDDVYGVDPLTQNSHGKLQRFVIGSGATTTSLPITPSLLALSTSADRTVANTPDDDDVITVYGTASTAHSQMLFYHPAAFACGFAELGVSEELKSVKNSEGGMTMQITWAGDIDNAETAIRIDVGPLGLAVPNPEFACRMYSP